MKLMFSRDYGTITVNFDEENRAQDMEKCRILEKLYNSEEWITLLELMGQAEQIYDQTVMKVKPQEQSFRETAIYAARKNGFTEAMALLRKAVEAYQFYKQEQKKIIESQIDSIMGREQEEVNYNG